MRTGRKNRRKIRKSRGYIVPMCLALSGTLMAGTATAGAGAECKDEITDDSVSQEYNKYQKVLVSDDGGTVTLHNIGLTSANDPDVHGAFLSGIQAPAKNITIEWGEDLNEIGSKKIQLSSVRGNSSKIEITAKNFKILSDFESTADEEIRRRYDNKGLFADANGSINVKVPGEIDLKTGEFPIFANNGKIEITGFTKLSAEDTGRQYEAGDAVRNANQSAAQGGTSSIRIVGTADSTISLISQRSNRDDGRTLPVVQDASQKGEGTLIQGGSIEIRRIALQPHSIVFTGYYMEEGHIDIEGGHAVIIGSPDHENEFAVQGFSQGNGFSTIDINTNSKGTVTINGRATAESAEVNIHYAGGGSLQNGDVLAAKSHQGSKDRFTEGDKLSYGGPGAKTGVMNLVFSGAGAGMKGNMTAEEGSSITADFSGDNAFFNGDITARKGERFTEGETSSVTVNASGNAKLSGDVSVEDGGMSNVNLSGESLWTGKSALSGTEAASNVSVNDNSTWKVTADSSVSTLKLSGGTVDLEGSAHQIKIGHLSADGTPGTFRMDMTYHDNQLSTYENAKDSDFLYVGGGEGQTFRVEAADNSSLNSMKDGDKLYFARTASGAAEFDVDHKVLIRNPDKIYNKVFRVKTEAVTSEAAAGDNTNTAASSGSVTGDSADTAAPAKAAAGARAKIATASMAAASAGENTAASSEAGTSGSENTTASSENNEDAWYLTPETTAVDNPLNPSDNAFIPNANAYVPGSAHNAAASIWRDNDTLLKRLGELRWSKNNDGAWGRVINRRLARSGTQAFDVSMNTLQLGYDRRIPLSFGDIFVGGAIEHSRGTEKYDDGDGSVYMTDGALYGTFKGRSGDYVDVVTKAGKLFTHYSSDFGDGGDFENWGFSASAEYGHKFDLGWSWSVEPQAQIRYSYLWGDDYTSDNGAKIYQDDTDSLVGRLGLLVAKEFGTGTENPVRVYAKGSVLHEFLGDRDETLYQDVAMHDSTDLAGTWYSAGVGANVGLSENCSLYVDAEEDFGTDIKVQYRIQGGFRFEF